MAKKDGLSLLDDHEWLGSFWRPSEEGSAQHAASLKYGPDSGLSLSLVTHTGSFDSNEFLPTLHGIAGEIGRVSLLSGRPNGSSTLSMGSGGYVSSTAIPFQYAVIGAHLDTNSTFAGASAAFNNLAEFFHPQGHWTTQRFKADGLLSSREHPIAWPRVGPSEKLRISIGMEARGAMLGSKVSSALLIDEAETPGLAEQLDRAAAEVLEMHPQGWLVAKDKIDYRVRFETVDESGVPISDVYDALSDIQGLFAILMQKPIRPIRVRISAKPRTVDGDEAAPYQLDVISSLAVSQRVLARLRKDESHYGQLPLKASDLDGSFENIAENWFRFLGIRPNLVVACVLDHLHDSGRSFERFLLQIAAIDQVANIEGVTDASTRYDWFIEQHASKHVLTSLADLLPNAGSRKSMGSILADLRNSIAHPRRLEAPGFRKIAETVLGTGLSNVIEHLHFMLVIYILRKIETPEEAIEDVLCRAHVLIPVFEPWVPSDAESD